MGAATREYNVYFAIRAFIAKSRHYISVNLVAIKYLPVSFTTYQHPFSLFPLMRFDAMIVCVLMWKEHSARPTTAEQRPLRPTRIFHGTKYKASIERHDATPRPARLILDS